MVGPWLLLSLAFWVGSGAVVASEDLPHEPSSLNYDVCKDDENTNVSATSHCNGNSENGVDTDHETGTCVDEESEEECAVLAARGECEMDPLWMLRNCRKSCKVCEDELPQIYEQLDVLDEGRSFGLRQKKLDSLITRRALHKSRKYLDSWLKVGGRSSAHIDCLNEDELCTHWAAFGECQSDADDVEWMRLYCAPACQTCSHKQMKTVYNTDCPVDRSLNFLRRSGDLNDLFRQIVDPTNEHVRKYNPVIISGPELSSQDWSVANTTENSGTDHNEDHEPWVVMLDNFLTAGEARHLIDLGFNQGFEHSQLANFDNGEDEGVVNTETRTSKTAWCFADAIEGDDDGSCYHDPVHRKILRRISRTVHVPRSNYESLQLLKYEGGDYYKVHHDYLQTSSTFQCGPRMLTFFLYLNDIYSEDEDRNGGTRFPNIKTGSGAADKTASMDGVKWTKKGLTIEPRIGRAVLWPSVLDEHPTLKDSRTMHEALPVPEDRRKFGANVWIHLRDYNRAHENGCC